jgi:D-proline reductase (dithiol) PrdB
MMSRGHKLMPINYIALMNAITPSLPPFPVAEMGEPALTELAGPLREARVMILSSAGVHEKSEPPFKPTNDMTFRRIAQSAAPEDLVLSHPAPVRRPGEADINVVHPYQRLAELADSGYIGGVTEYHLSILGAIKLLNELVTDLVPQLAEDARAAGADLVLAVPLCPACHQAVGIISRGLEREGIPTVTMTGARDITERIRPPRSAFLNYPLGNSVGAPGDDKNQRDILVKALAISESVSTPGAIIDLPFDWPETGWEAETIALYNRDSDTVLRQRQSSEYKNGANIAITECTDVCSLV